MDELTAVRGALDRLVAGALAPLIELLAKDVEFEVASGGMLPDGREVPGFIDCYRRGCFILEAKNEDELSRPARMRPAKVPTGESAIRGRLQALKLSTLHPRFPRTGLF